MNQQIQQIADRIKELREILDIPAEELAKKLGISEEQYNEYENAQTDIPIGVLYGIAAEMGTDPTVLLTGDAPRMDEYTLVRKGKGVKIERYKGYDFSSLAFNFKNRDMEPMIVHVSPQNNCGELFSHGGQEFNYVLSGVVKVIIGKREFILNEGDSIYFNPMAPHGQRAVGGDAAFLTVINE
jgi:transcriptional regulator with XRE-family HTH domain